jgi:hypothetical protein
MSYKIKSNNTMYAYRIWNEVEKHFEASGQGGLYSKRRSVWLGRGAAQRVLDGLPHKAECVIKTYELVEIDEVEDDETDPA